MAFWFINSKKSYVDDACFLFFLQLFIEFVHFLESKLPTKKDPVRFLLLQRHKNVLVKLEISSILCIKVFNLFMQILCISIPSDTFRD